MSISIFHQCLRKTKVQEKFISKKLQKESILVLGDSHAKVFQIDEEREKQISNFNSYENPTFSSD